MDKLLLLQLNHKKYLLFPFSPAHKLILTWSMITYKDLKSVAYIDSVIPYVEEVLGIQFKRYGEHKYSAYCPFHADTKDSFRVYVDDNQEIRFHCFGACNADWDVYNLIQIRKGCNFRQAQVELAKALGINKFEVYNGKSQAVPDPEDVEEPDESVEISEPAVLYPEIVEVLEHAANFYHELLMTGDEFEDIHDYLSRRGVTDKHITDYKIGYCPAYTHETKGRALINTNLERFERDYQDFNLFVNAGLFRLLNDENNSWARRYIDFSRKDPFSQNYADFFAGRITFPVYDACGRIQGFMGRRADNRGKSWIKQQQLMGLNTKQWLYGIDKAARWISHYQSVILVEGIFDYFAFCILTRRCPRSR